MKIANLFKKTEPPKERVMIEIQMENGSVEKYPENFVINEEYCVGCGDTYHWHMDCPSFKRMRDLKPALAMSRKDAESKGLEKCWQCDDYDRLEET